MKYVILNLSLLLFLVSCGKERTNSKSSLLALVGQNLNDGNFEGAKGVIEGKVGKGKVPKDPDLAQALAAAYAGAGTFSMSRLVSIAKDLENADINSENIAAALAQLRDVFEIIPELTNTQKADLAHAIYILESIDIDYRSGAVNGEIASFNVEKSAIIVYAAFTNLKEIVVTANSIAENPNIDSARSAESVLISNSELFIERVFRAYQLSHYSSESFKEIAEKIDNSIKKLFAGEEEQDQFVLDDNASGFFAWVKRNWELNKSFLMNKAASMLSKVLPADINLSLTEILTALQDEEVKQHLDEIKNLTKLFIDAVLETDTAQDPAFAAVFSDELIDAIKDAAADSLQARSLDPLKDLFEQRQADDQLQADIDDVTALLQVLAAESQGLPSYVLVSDKVDSLLELLRSMNPSSND
jgi:hypothetical protein